jgi:hypothetical protein
LSSSHAIVGQLEDRPQLANQFDVPHEVLAVQRALRRLAAADLRGMDAAGALPFKARLARRSAASRLSSACFVETVAICAARRSAELGWRAVGCADTVTFCLTAIAVSFSVSPISADHGLRGFAHLSASRSRSPADSARKTIVNLLDLFPPGYSRRIV